MTRPPALLIVSHDVVGSQMAGPGIRYFHLARVLAHELPVVLAVPGHSSNDLTLPNVTFATYQANEWSSLAPLFAQATVALLPTALIADYPQVADVDAALVIDGYNPLLAEWLAVYRREALNEAHSSWHKRLERLAAPIYVGDFFICASERQRDWWLGQLEAHGRINPATYQADPTLRQLLDVVAYGLPVESPAATRPFIKGVWEGIAPTDKVVLWGGGLWPWLDPLTAIEAIHHLAATRPEIKLIFPGTRHPNKNVAGMPTRHADAQALADRHGLTNRNVFFGDWVAFPDWPNVLLESDVALTLHTESVESRLAFRSRVLDYVWAELPVVATTGDATSDLIAEYGLGIQVRANDAADVAAAIVTLIDEAPTARDAAFTRAQAELNWERAAAPLAAFCRAPRRAPDRDQHAPGDKPRDTQDEGWIPDPHRYERELAPLRDLVKRYEQGRMMRLLRSFATLRRQLLGNR